MSSLGLSYAGWKCFLSWPIPARDLDPQIPQSSWGKESDCALIPILEKSARLGQITFVARLK